MKFEPGRSGNPKGRPPGSQNRATRFRQQLEGAAPQVIEKVVAAALGGDLSACKLVLERVCPALRPAELPPPPPPPRPMMTEEQKREHIDRIFGQSFRPNPVPTANGDAGQGQELAAPSDRVGLTPF
jgi:hypothetical protein